ncbi:tripartite motif-containing protein 29 [Kryptolebias marmoratus]|uniref:tripartite motif-containing protein 29 n=1 Tax=Kryptolebias marmoratus TaxID=37003 RepID=UPI000D530756|nr:tripartite motif-containing protein 29 [Kryptolebias marmoratus]
MHAHTNTFRHSSFCVFSKAAAGITNYMASASSVQCDEQFVTDAKPGEVPCDVCMDLNTKALKTCLVCLVSYCQLHLGPHRHLKNHKLVDPVSNLEDRVCKRHDKLLELFCRTDQESICPMCLNDTHVAHDTVPLEHVLDN